MSDLSKREEGFGSLPVWVWAVGGAAVVLLFYLLFSSSSGSHAPDADANDLNLDKIPDSDKSEFSSENYEDFADTLKGMSSFDDLVSATTETFATNEDRNANMLLAQGILLELSIEKITELSDMYAQVASTWWSQFGETTRAFMKSNESLYSEYASSLDELKQCAVSSVHYETTETHVQTKTTSETNVLMGILGDGSSGKTTDVNKVTHTPHVFCEQWQVDPAGAAASLAGMTEVIKANYLTWLTNLNQMPTFISVLGI